MPKNYIGCGADFAGDRYDAVVPVVEAQAECDGPKFLIYEVLSERTLAIAQRARLYTVDAGYSLYL
tara:strand:- start:11 stop:208 length:198 start_codon:yes stop_codon:yes gene_type:complete